MVLRWHRPYANGLTGSVGFFVAIGTERGCSAYYAKNKKKL